MPQTVCQATGAGWEWLRFRCFICQHSGTVPLALRGSAETLESIARRARCSRCRRWTETRCWLGADRGYAYEQEVTFEGALIGPVEHHG